MPVLETMAWYNPFSWFGREDRRAPSSGPDDLVCGNPECEYPNIPDAEVAYDAESRKVYHPNGDCALKATAHEALRSGSMSIRNVEFIAREQALELLKSGGIESKVN